MGGRLSVMAVAATLTLALGAPGLALASAQSASSQNWTASKLPLPAGADASSYRPLALSCSSSTQCAGGGSYAVTALDFPAALLTLSGDKWTDVEAPLPSGAIAHQLTPALTTASCPVKNSCFAGGHYQDSYGQLGMLLAWSGKKWTAARATLPAGVSADTGGVVTSISCPSATWCTGVGWYDVPSATNGLILRRSDGKWTAAKAPVPAGALATGELEAVACPSDTRCFAGGWDQPEASSSSQLLMLTWYKGKWAAVKVPQPAGAATANVVAIACATATRCVAVVSYVTTAEATGTELLTWTGTTWTARKPPLPAGAESQSVSLYTAACAPSSRCIVGGTYQDASAQSHGLLLTWSGSSWTATEAPSAVYAVHAASCPSATRCFAVGSGAGNGLELLTGP